MSNTRFVEKYDQVNFEISCNKSQEETLQKY